MDLKLDKKIALVTGSSRGIGKEISKILLNEGCQVILHGRNESSLKKTAKELKVGNHYVVGDVTDIQDCKKIIRSINNNFGELDILICNVGNGSSVKLGTETNNDWTKMFEINFNSTVNMINASKESLKKTKGTITCISSIAGLEYTGAPLPYSVSKSALISYVKIISHHLAKFKIRINVVSPGNIIFPGSVWEQKLSKNSKQVKEMLKRVALNRFGTPDEIGNVVVFLSSQSASFLTGSNIVVDGGQIRSF